MAWIATGWPSSSRTTTQGAGRSGRHRCRGHGRPGPLHGWRCGLRARCPCRQHRAYGRCPRSPSMQVTLPAAPRKLPCPGNLRADRTPRETGSDHSRLSRFGIGWLVMQRSKRAYPMRQSRPPADRLNRSGWSSGPPAAFLRTGTSRRAFMAREPLRARRPARSPNSAGPPIPPNPAAIIAG
jgi:hypothetical protein